LFSDRSRAIVATLFTVRFLKQFQCRDPDRLCFEDVHAFAVLLTPLWAAKNN